MPTTSPHPASSQRDSDPELPSNFDPDLNPILAVHWFGINPHELRDVREVYWSLARQGYPPTTKTQWRCVGTPAMPSTNPDSTAHTLRSPQLKTRGNQHAHD